MSCLKMIEKVRQLNKDTPDGYICDADTLLCDVIQNADLDFEITGLAEDLFNIYQKSRDKQAVKETHYRVGVKLPIMRGGIGGRDVFKVTH